MTYKFFKGSLEAELKQLEELKRKRKKNIIVNSINWIWIFLLIFFWYLITISLLHEVLQIHNLRFLTINFLFWGLFFSITWIILVFFLKDRKYLWEKIKELEKLIELRKEENTVYKTEIRPIEKLVQNLKYKININHLQDDKFSNSLKTLKIKTDELILSEIKYWEHNDLIVLEKINTFIKLIYNWDYNWFNTSLLLEQFNDKKELLTFLFYITQALKKIEEIWTGDFSNFEENERFFLSLKKQVEKRFSQVRKEKKINESISEVSFDLDDKF